MTAMEIIFLVQGAICGTSVIALIVIAIRELMK
ncbi:hypothetical protein [Megaira polyxenophila phage MAnkyphage_25.80]|nr:hypothetical protein [Megaira polyxenophila phage MAnkyphage_25.80]